MPAFAHAHAPLLLRLSSAVSRLTGEGYPACDGASIYAVHLSTNAYLTLIAHPNMESGKPIGYISSFRILFGSFKR